METAVGALSERRKIVILGSCCLSLLIVSMDSTIVNVALPTIRADFGATTSQLQWVIDIYTLGLASLLMLSGAAGTGWDAGRSFTSGCRSSRSVRCSAVWRPPSGCSSPPVCSRRWVDRC